MGSTIKPGLHLEMEAEDGYAALGYMSGLSAGISSDYYLTSVVEYAHSAMARDFNENMLVISQTNPQRFQHVYEPGEIGVPGMELWEHKLYGRGKTRQAAFEWRDSKMPILTPEERLHNAANPEDPINLVHDEVDPEVWDKLNEGSYVFRLRAPIMEYGLSVHITPRPGTKFLFIPTIKTNYHRSGKKDNPSYTPHNFRFEKYNKPNWNYVNPQEPSVEGTTVGQFSAQWVAFWSGGGADATWNSNVQKAISGGIAEAEIEMKKVVKRRTRKRRGVANIATFSDAYAAEESGRNLALAFMKGKARSYSQAAKYIERKGYFGGEEGY